MHDKLQSADLDGQWLINKIQEEGVKLTESLIDAFIECVAIQCQYANKDYARNSTYEYYKSRGFKID